MVISVGHVFNRSSGTDLVSDALVEDKERVGGLDMFVVWGDEYDLEIQKLQRLPSGSCDEVATVMVLLFTDVPCARTCMPVRRSECLLLSTTLQRRRHQRSVLMAKWASTITERNGL